MKTLFLTLFAAASLMAGDAQTTTSKKTEKPSIGPTQLSPAGSATDHDRASKDATPAALDREQKIFQKLQYGVWITFDDPAQPAVLLNSLKPAIQQVTDEGTVNKDGPTLPPPVDDNIDAYSQTTEHQRRGEQVVFDNSGLKDPRASVPRRFTDMEMIAVVDAFVMLDPEFEQAK